MARLIDSSVLVAWKRRSEPFDDFLATWQGEDIAVAAVTISELLVGVFMAEPGRRREQRHEFVEEVAARINVLPFDLRSARFHAQLVARLQDQGQPIGSLDTLIAATALAHDCAVVTDNVKHLERFHGLAVERPPWSE